MLSGCDSSISMVGTTKSGITSKLGITLPVSLVKQSDRILGDILRSTFIRRAVEQYMKGKSVSK